MRREQVIGSNNLSNRPNIKIIQCLESKEESMEFQLNVNTVMFT